MALKQRFAGKLVAMLKWLLFLALGVGLIWFSLHSIPDDKWDDFVRSLRTARYWLIVPVFFILSGSHWLRAYRWQLLIEPLGKKPRLLNAFFAVMIGYLANLAVPRLGEVMRCTLLSRYEKIPAEELIGTVVAERAFDVVCLGIVFLLALVFQYDIVWTFLQQSLAARNAGAPKADNGPSILIYVLIAFLLAGIIAYLLRKRFAGRLYRKIRAAIIGLKKGLLSAGRLQHKTQFFLSTASIWALYVVGTWLGYLATAGSDHMGLQVACTGLAFGSVGMILTPGGIGSYALFLAEALKQNGVAYEIGYANGTLQWFAQFAVVIVVGSLCLLLMPLYNRKTARHEIHTNHRSESPHA